MRETSLHELGIRKVIARHPPGKVNRWKLNQFIKELGNKFDASVEYYIWHVPDAWSYDPHHSDKFPGTINLFEIEDKNSIDLDKLRDYSTFWFMCDCIDLGVRLFVYDRYGENERELRLKEYGEMLLAADAQRHA